MPTYRVPPRLLLRLGGAMLGLGETSLVRDSVELAAGMVPAPRLSGAEHIPQTGPFVAVANHCQRHGLWIGFPSAVLTEAVAGRRPGAAPLHWAVVAQTRLWDGRVPVPGTRWAYREVARCYEMVPLPPARRAVAGRAGALRRLARLALPPPRGRGEPVALYPEGERGTAAGLVEPLAGAGALLGMLAAGGVPALPVGVAEEEEGLRVRVGAPFRLGTRDDRAAAEEVMRRIAALLPGRMRGGYRPWGAG
jgi:1-acyl-sn-glycerol-3-phosphate acyltransferase